MGGKPMKKKPNSKVMYRVEWSAGELDFDERVDANNYLDFLSEFIDNVKVVEFEAVK